MVNALDYFARSLNPMMTTMKVKSLLSRRSSVVLEAGGDGVLVDTLCEFSRLATQIDLDREPGPQLASLIQSIFSVQAVALLDADLHKVYEAGDWFEDADLENMLWNVHVFEAATESPHVGLTQRVLRIGNLPIGAMLLRGQISPSTSNTVAHLVSITLDRFHSHANVSRTESARQAEQLRTTVLDSLAHAYKTPLTAIMAASTGLSAMGCLTPAQSALVALIDEQALLLNELATRLLKTARLEAHELMPRMETVALAPLIEQVVASFRDQLASLSVDTSVRKGLSIWCDRDLLVALITQYLDNAAKYSIAGSTVTIHVEERSREVVLSVHNVGPVIPSADLERVFDRFFRCASSVRSTPGTGIGLSVAKRAAQAHAGHVWVTSNWKKGTTFFASLPLIPKGACGA
jgi:two-component system, OmpR family, sensor histidine kinase KdpD